MIPPKLKKGDQVRVVAPAHSFSAKFNEDMKKKAAERLQKLGLTVSFGKYVDELDDFKTTTVEHRLEDLHEAFADRDVNAIMAVRGGSSSNQLLKYIDYKLIQKNPKIFCGLSDITELTNAIYTKTGLVTYYGPHYTMLGATELIDHTIDNMKKTFFSKEKVVIEPSKYYANSEWEDEVIVNKGFWCINEGEVEAECIGGNLRTFSLTLGAEYSPDIEKCILFLEDNKIIDFRGVQKEIQSILNQHQGNCISGLILGRFQRQTGMTRELLTKIIKSKKELEGVPVIGNVDFGHTVPIATIPVGGVVRISAGHDQVKIELLQH